MESDRNRVTREDANGRRCGRSSVDPGGHMAAIPKDVRRELVRLRRPDNWRNLIFLGYDWTLIAGAAVAAESAKQGPFRWIVYFFAIVVIGSRQRGLMNLVHEASHRKLFRNRRLNDWGGRLLAAFPLLASLEAYVCSHCRHHGFLGDGEKDPKTKRYAQLGLIVAPRKLRQFVRKHLLKPLLLGHVPFNVLGAVDWKGEPRFERVARVVFWVVAIPLIVVAGLGMDVLLYWVVPFLTTFQVIRYYTEMAEHAGLDTKDPWNATRNWTGSFLTRWLLAPHYDDSYHLVHHLFVWIPHYRLAVAHRILMQVPEYAAGHHCDGFFFPRRPDAPPVVRDIARPDELGRYKMIPRELRGDGGLRPA
jgi:fatty acid desaturase